LIAPVNSRGWDRPVPSYFALPPMAKDLEEPLEKIIDMRVFTPTAKLENLHHFVKTSFENL
jgi:hypothetical protein